MSGNEFIDIGCAEARANQRNKKRAIIHMKLDSGIQNYHHTITGGCISQFLYVAGTKFQTELFGQQQYI